MAWPIWSGSLAFGGGMMIEKEGDFGFFEDG
jgi:hypothetical protein